MANANLLQNFYIKVEHLTLNPGSTTQESFTQDLSLQAVHVNIQPASKEVLALYGGAFGKAYTIFTTLSGILQTDRLTTVSGIGNPIQYIVKGREEYNYFLGQNFELYVEALA